MTHQPQWATPSRPASISQPPTPPPHLSTIPIPGPLPGYNTPANPAQLLDNPTGRLSCGTCEMKPPQVIPCTACECVFYCSPRCRVANAAAHRLFCSSLALAQDPAVMISGPLAGLTGRYDRPFERLWSGRFFEGVPERDVYVLLVDMYRLMLHDERRPVVEVAGGQGRDFGESVGRGVGGGGVMTRARMFFAALGAVDRGREGLPSWWGPECVPKVLQVGMENRGGNFHYLGRWVTVRMLADYYGHPLVPLQLRMLGQVLTGRVHVSGVDLMPLVELCKELEGCDEAQLFLKQRNDRLGV